MFAIQVILIIIKFFGLNMTEAATYFSFTMRRTGFINNTRF
jgi:hypothetical protein